MSASRKGDRHINQSISVRLGPLQPRLEAYLKTLGVPDGPMMQTAMRSWIKDSVGYRLDVLQGATLLDQSDDE
jgi:hypothetical protein